MNNEQLCGRNLTRLGHPSIQLIGQFNELVLFKDSKFDDQLVQYSPKNALKQTFTFCKWKLIRKVFNEVGVCHIEKGMFYKQGVLSNISALQENVMLKVKNFILRH